MQWMKVDGTDMGSVQLFALSTCGWCRKTKTLLDEMNVAYEYMYVDQLSGAEREEAIQAASKWNPARSFPVIVFGGSRAVLGFKPDDIKRELENGK